MAGNEWINGYLEAILDAGSGRGGLEGHGKEDRGNTIKNIRKKFEDKFRYDFDKEKGEKAFNPTKYFVEEVVNCFDESDLHRTWVKIAWLDAQRLTKQRLESEKGRNDAAEDLSELSEGEKEKGDASQTESPSDKIPRINSDMQCGQTMINLASTSS